MSSRAADAGMRTSHGAKGKVRDVCGVEGVCPQALHVIKKVRLYGVRHQKMRPPETQSHVPVIAVGGW